MTELKPYAEIGGADAGWLRAKHHFAIKHYGNPAHGPLGNLYVLNDDEIAPHSGFGLHYHANVDIVTYVREGVVTHEGNLGNKGHILFGDEQVMSSGTGIGHSERNDENVPTRLFQIWLTRREEGGSPQWGSKPFPKENRSGQFALLASGRSASDALPIRADAEVSGANLKGGTTIEHTLQKGDLAYLVPATGSVTVNGVHVKARDGPVIRKETSVRIEAMVNVEVLLIVTSNAQTGRYPIGDHRMKHTKVFFCAVAILALVCLPSLVHALTHTKTTESERKVSLTVRRLMWDSYFNNDQGQLKRLIGEDLLTINPGEEHWQDKAEFLAGAQGFLEHQGKLASLIFPKTEIQEVGGVAVLYSTV